MSKEREYKKALKELTQFVDTFLGALDAEMKKPSTEDRGRRVAMLSNKLEMGNDHVRHFTLGEKFPLKKSH
jgi:hypothetical protein